MGGTWRGEPCAPGRGMVGGISEHDDRGIVSGPGAAVEPLPPVSSFKKRRKSLEGLRD